MSLEEKIREKAQSLIRKHQQCWTIKSGGVSTSSWVIKTKYLEVFIDDVLAIIEKVEKQNLDLFDRLEKINDYKDEQINKLKEGIRELAELLKNLPDKIDSYGEEYVIYHDSIEECLITIKKKVAKLLEVKQ